jgi:hypothetical protein
MKPVRNVLNELVERRLWPVALLLVLALVAVPLLLAKSPSSTAGTAAPDAASPAGAAIAAAAAAAAPSPPPGGGPVVSVAQGEEPKARLRGQAKNPFRQQHVPAAPTTSTVTAATAGASSSPAPTGGPGDSGSAGRGNPHAHPQPRPEPQPTFAYASIDVRFGHAGKRLRTIRDVPRLTPLPNATHPVVVFLGTRRDRATAVFLVSTDVHVQGLGQCVPAPKDCEAIELREGDTAFLDFTEADGTVQQYELDLDGVALHTTTSAAEARSAYARVSRAGKLLVGGRVRTSTDGAARAPRLPFRYVARDGVLHIAPWASRRARAARAHGAISGGSLADLAPAGP